MYIMVSLSRNMKMIFPWNTPYIFGNLTGTDYYSGKNGVIIGTPHFPSYLYQLIAFSIGISEHGSLKIEKLVIKDTNF